MPYRQKGSPHWYISYTDPQGRRVRESSGTTAHAEAKALESSRRAESYRARKWGEQPKYLFDEVMARYLADTTSKKSHVRDLFSAVPLTEHFSGKAVDEITAEDCTAYKDKRRKQKTTSGTKTSDATIAKELLLGSAAVNYVITHLDWKVSNPFRRRAPKVTTDAPRWLSQKEAKALIAGCLKGRGAAKRESPMVLDFVELGLATGMRSGEILGLEWARVDFGARLIYFGKDDQKGGRPGSIPMSDWAISVLRRRLEFRKRHCPRSRWVFCDSKGKRTGSLKKAFGRATERARLRGVTPHTLRHTCAAWLVQADVPLRTVSELLRHKDIRTTMRYSHLGPHNAREAVKHLDRIQTSASHSLSFPGTRGHKMTKIGG